MKTLEAASPPKGNENEYTKNRKVRTKSKCEDTTSTPQHNKKQYNQNRKAPQQAKYEDT